MPNKRKNVLLSSKELKAKIKSLECDFESISSMHFPNKNLVNSMKKKMYHLTDQLKKAERWERQKHERQIARKNDRKNTLARKHEQKEKHEIKNAPKKPPKIDFGGTLTLP